MKQEEPFPSQEYDDEDDEEPEEGEEEDYNIGCDD